MKNKEVEVDKSFREKNFNKEVKENNKTLQQDSKLKELNYYEMELFTYEKK